MVSPLNNWTVLYRNNFQNREEDKSARRELTAEELLAVESLARAKYPPPCR